MTANTRPATQICVPVVGLALYYDDEDQDAGEAVRLACDRTVRAVLAPWGLPTPRDCRVYLMTSPLQFFWRSAPWPWRLGLCISVPLWYPRVQRIWRFAGGWVQRYGRRIAVGVKPPRLLQLGDSSLGDRIFVREGDLEAKLQRTTCHELTHAFTAHLRLPAWLNEGLAMLAVDRFCGRPMVRDETIHALANLAPRSRPRGYRSLQTADGDALVYHYVRGYWITRYAAEKQPALLKALLGGRQRPPELERTLGAALGVEPKRLWQEIDAAVLAHFEGSNPRHPAPPGTT